MATARAQHTATLLLPSGKVLVAGGLVSDPAGGFSNVGSAELYDPATGLFVETGSMTTGRRLHTATLLLDGKVLLAGGVSPAGDLVTSAELYDPTTGTFAATGSMVAARLDHTATLLQPSGKVLIVGGNLPDGTTASAELYDPATGTFTKTGDTIIARDGHTATLLQSGKVLIAGGSGFNAVNTELYDPATGTFGDTGAMVKNRNGHTATLLASGKVLVAGGLSPGHPTTLEASAELYDPATGTFSDTGSMTIFRDDHTATLLQSGKVLVAGGVTVDSSGESVAASSADLFDPDTNTFAATGSMVFGREGQTATLLLPPSGKVLVAGGFDTAGNAVSSAELYDPGTSGTPTCSFAIAPTSQAFGPVGGSDSVTVTAPAGCAWTAASNDLGVVTVTSGASGAGPGAVGYTVSANGGPARQGRLTIAGQTFTVNQDSGCTFSIAPSSASFPAGGGTDKVTVTAAAGCAWTASSNDPSVVAISAGTSGAGGGLVQYLVAANSGPARKATLTIAGQTFTVNQGSGCPFAFAPTSAHLAPAGGSGSFTVTTAAGCDWTATSQDPSWLTVTSGASGSGPGTVGYSAAANSGPARSSAIRVGGQSFAVTQDGITALNTPTGVNIGVSLLGGALRIFFPAVVTAGVTTVTPTDPCTQCSLPGGYVRFGNLGFDIQTTAVTTGPITLAFDLELLVPPNPITPPNPVIPPNPLTPQLVATLRVLHGESGVLVDRTITTPPNPIIPPNPIVPPNPIRTIFASVASLSPFVIAQLGPELLLQVAHDGLVVLRQGTTDARKSRALDVAIGALQRALAPAHWIDAFHVTPAGGISTAIDTALAVASLAAYRGDPAVQLAINQILGADVELVRTAISKAGGP